MIKSASRNINVSKPLFIASFAPLFLAKYGSPPLTMMQPFFFAILRVLSLELSSATIVVKFLKFCCFNDPNKLGKCFSSFFVGIIIPILGFFFTMNNCVQIYL